MTDSVNISDPLSDIAAASGLACTGVVRRGLSGAFALALPAASHALVHVVVRGRAVLEGASEDTVELTAGQIAVLPHQTAHTIADAWPPTVTPTASDEECDSGTILSIGASDAVETVLLSLPFFLPSRDASPAANVLPMLRVLRVPNPELVEMVLLISKLALLPGPGDHYVACRIAEGVLTKTLTQLAGAEEDRYGVFAMFASVGVKAALKAVQLDPSRPWSVGDLAAIAGMSRKEFVADFNDTVGTNVQDFVSTRRVRFAESLLRSGTVTIESLADRAGFRTEGAFRRAFKQVTGHIPGAGVASVVTKAGSAMDRVLARLPTNATDGS